MPKPPPAITMPSTDAPALTEHQARAIEMRASAGGGPAPSAYGRGSWSEPFVRGLRKGRPVATRCTNLHIPLELAERVDALRMKTHRRMSDIVAAALEAYLPTQDP